MPYKIVMSFLSYPFLYFQNSTLKITMQYENFVFRQTFPHFHKHFEKYKKCVQGIYDIMEVSRIE